MAGIAIEIDGLDADMRDAVLASLDLAQYAKRDVRPRQAQRLFQRAPAQIRDALEPFGYLCFKDAVPVDDPPTTEPVLKVKEGDQVVLHPSDRVRDGVRVTPRSPGGRD